MFKQKLKLRQISIELDDLSYSYYREAIYNKQSNSRYFAPLNKN